ncbi:uncharacterized protein C3orf85 homolog isoform X2 [Pseudophryne corroboree]|uniref:uncharacterized protein C3orf85 homolog isoform X2 n=1 Tax=Pseudophryne corroboree TaxID=495146 RepID=UPI003081C3F3
MRHSVIILFHLFLSIQGILGAPFFTEEAANQFLRLKRQAFSKHFWEPDLSETTWVSTITQEASDTWRSLLNSAQYYLSLEPADSSYYPSAIGNQLKVYIGVFWPWESNEQDETYTQN